MIENARAVLNMHIHPALGLLVVAVVATTLTELKLWWDTQKDD